MLVVDDDVGVREALHLILEEEYEVVDAGDGPGAVATVRSQPIDLVLLDILLPGIDGIEVLQELKVIDPEIPVIMMTAVKTIRTSVTAMKLGALDYVTKPFQEEELLRIVRGAVEPRRRRRTTGEQPVRRLHKTRLRRLRRILIVDHDAGRRAALAVLLTRFGVVMTPAEGARTLQGIGRSPSLCVVLGVDRAQVRVMETLRSVRTRFPVCPIIAGLDSDDRQILRELEVQEIQEILHPRHSILDVVHRVSSLLTPGSGSVDKPARLSDPVREAVRHICSKYGERLSVESIAGAVGVSASRLAHVFRADVGMTLMDLVVGVRVEIAKQLLATKTHNLAQVAALTGFFDASHLSRAFLRITGHRPGEHRRPQARVKVRAHRRI